MSIRVTLRDIETGVQHSHMVAEYGDYATLCGLSDNDDQFEIVSAMCGASPIGGIDCDACYAAFRTCKSYRAKDFKQASSKENGNG